MTDYSEPDLVYLLERLVSLNYKSLPKSRRKAPVTNESWGTAACQKRRLQKLKGQKPYYKASRALYKCSTCENQCIACHAGIDYQSPEETSTKVSVGGGSWMEIQINPAESGSAASRICFV
ncbi:hypothetical protein FOTG_17542 [Fusarium oxysporum f. sp. vasinfectum 25433]|uniref:Uncharacterized protein n=1 Tax=Fusarium oxysporum f. sp. vasinfectum 25433 TaxID=1089449 RepID=X0KYZ0_FUSOX|nr:hypothetical protein FOTG_17542 [Fusarium oxysporum f. sp. vasinfectum 25433]